MSEEERQLRRQVQELQATLAGARVEAERLHKQISRTDSQLVEKYSNQTTVTGADVALVLEKIQLLHEQIHKIDLRIQAIENWQIDTMMGS